VNKFRLSKIDLNNYKLFEKRHIDFDKVDLFVLDGPNGYGKTSIFEAIEYLLTGNIKRAEQCPELSGKLSYNTHFLAKDVKKNVIICGEFLSEKSILKIERSINVQSISGVKNNPKNLKSVTYTKIWFEGENIYNGFADGADDIIKRYLGNSVLEYYDKFYYISQEDRLKFLMAPETKRMEQISSLFNIDNEINEYIKFNNFKNKLSKKVNNLKKENNEERKTFEEYKQEIQEIDINKRDYKDLFIECDKKPYWNERVVKIKDKEKLNEILLELKNAAMLSRNLELFQISLDNSKFNFYKKDLVLLKKLLVYSALNKNIDDEKMKYDIFIYLKSLPMKEDSKEIDIEMINYKELNENLRINVEIDSILQLQTEILTARKNQSKLNKSLEKLQNARANLSSSFKQWKAEGGPEIEKNVCPYCGHKYDFEVEYETAVTEVTKTLEECSDAESDKIKVYLASLQKEFDKKFKGVISDFINQNKYMENELIKSIMAEISSITEKHKEFIVFLQKQKLNLKDYNVRLDDEFDWEVKVKQFIKIINESYIRPLTDEYYHMQDEYCFYEIFNSVFDGKIKNISYISEADENEKRLYLEEQYQLQEHEKMNDMEKRLLKKEKFVQDLEEMKNKIEKIVTIYKNNIGKYQKEIIGEIQIPLYIYSGRVLQYYQGGLGIFVKYDTKEERLDAIRLLSSNKSDHDVLYTLSSGQLTGVIIALTLTLNKIYGNEKFSCILIDDPVQTMDDLNIASLVELLRNEFKDYQMIVSTHEEDFSRFIRYKFEKYNLITRRYKLNG